MSVILVLCVKTAIGTTFMNAGLLVQPHRNDANGGRSEAAERPSSIHQKSYILANDED